MKENMNSKKDGTIVHKYCEDDRGQKNGLYISYHFSGIPIWKCNYINGKKYGLRTWYYKSGKIEQQKYFL